jgi:hypothetical protein
METPGYLGLFLVIQERYRFDHDAFEVGYVSMGDFVHGGDRQKELESDFSKYPGDRLGSGEPRRWIGAAIYR